MCRLWTLVLSTVKNANSARANWSHAQGNRDAIMGSGWGGNVQEMQEPSGVREKMRGKICGSSCLSLLDPLASWSSDPPPSTTNPFSPHLFSSLTHLPLRLHLTNTLALACTLSRLPVKHSLVNSQHITSVVLALKYLSLSSWDPSFYPPLVQDYCSARIPTVSISAASCVYSLLIPSTLLC